MALPGVEITLGNGGLGRVSATDDGIAALLLTGTEVSITTENEKGETVTKTTLEWGKHYQLSSTKDLDTLGITSKNNPLVYKEVCSFYAQAGEGAELHLMVVDPETKLSDMVSTVATSPLPN